MNHIYTEHELVRIARRENNTKRNYLVVNQLQGKHIPVVPSQALHMFQSLGRILQSEYPNERLLLIGFAETATAIGAAIAIMLECDYIQTSREDLGDVTYLHFSETHSHATEQKLVKTDLDRIMPLIDRIIFIEDEITTGNTIMNIVKLLCIHYPLVTYAAASMLNGMDTEAKHRYHQQGIALHYLVKTDHSRYAAIVAGYQGDGVSHSLLAPDLNHLPVDRLSGSCNARRLIDAAQLKKSCQTLWEQIQSRYPLNTGQSILVLGTEEFMYPPLFVAAQMEAAGCLVKYHATTRSPILVSADPAYPFHERYELRSFYDDKRQTFIYALDKYDQVFVITDADESVPVAESSLLMSLKDQGNQNIKIIRWCE